MHADRERQGERTPAPAGDAHGCLLPEASRSQGTGSPAPTGEAPEDPVYALTQATTEAFNELNEEFFQAGSEIETAAREAIGGDIDFILKAYGYDVDIEE